MVPEGKASVATTTTTVADSPHPGGWASMKTLRSKARGALGAESSLSDGDAAAASCARDGDSKGAMSVRGESAGRGYEVLNEVRSDDGLLDDGEEGGWRAESSGARELRDRSRDGAPGDGAGAGGIVYKVYKRRWFGLVQLVLLNVIVSWDWLTFSAISSTSAQYFNVLESSINWLSTAFLFAFVVASPAVVWTLHRGGPKQAIIAASVLLLAGNWIRYGGTRSNAFGAVMLGQILTGLAQPFVLSAPTRYSDLWFTGAGRVAATAVMSLANPFGGALAQLIDPLWADAASDIPNMVLYVTIISSIATIPSFFIPAGPPTPCAASSSLKKQEIAPSLRILARSPEFWMIVIPYAVLVGFFNSLSSLINQILAPYGFSETQAGIAGALLIVVGLVTAAISSPVIDKSKKYLWAIKIQVPIVSLAYLAFVWAPATRTEAAVYAILSVLGAASFSLVPIVLEFLCEITHPISPEITSTICWTGGQFLGGLFIVISNSLKDGPSGGPGGSEPFNMQRVLWFQAVIALLIVPLPLCLGLFGRRKHVSMRRVEADHAAARSRIIETDAAGTSV